MIVTTVSGGIGNQLFMYAAARAMSLRKGTGLILNDVTGFLEDKEYKRSFELGCFNLKYEHNAVLSFQYPCAKYFRKISKNLKRNILAPHYTYLTDSTRNTGVDNHFFDIEGDNFYLDGYWQSEDYFKDYEKEIRQDLSFKYPLSESIKEIEKDIFSETRHTPVCMGVRRYQEVLHSMDFEICGRDYYLNAMDYMARRVNNPVFYVFTQDKEWVKQEFASYKDNPIVVLPESSTIEDLYLMSKFKYHIISNSSFYWWGAWLAKGHIVVSTTEFKNKKCNCLNWHII